VRGGGVDLAPSQAATSPGKRRRGAPVIAGAAPQDGRRAALNARRRRRQESPAARPLRKRQEGRAADPGLDHPAACARTARAVLCQGGAVRWYGSAWSVSTQAATPAGRQAGWRCRSIRTGKNGRAHSSLPWSGLPMRPFCRPASMAKFLQSYPMSRMVPATPTRRCTVSCVINLGNHDHPFVIPPTRSWTTPTSLRRVWGGHTASCARLRPPPVSDRRRRAGACPDRLR
jgi:hypothetical protein